MSLIRSSLAIRILAFGFYGCIALAYPAFSGENPWSAGQVMQPNQLAEVLKSAPSDSRPLLVHVGFEFLYRNGHIPGSRYAGPAKEDAGLKRLRTELNNVPRSREIVLYCGCCPLSKCPNLRPAFRAVQAMGFRKVRILHLADNFEKDWIRKGYPTDKQ